MYVLTIIFSFCISKINAQGNIKANPESFPINFNGEMIDKLPNLDGTMIAFNGVINQIEKSKNKTPFYKLDLGNYGSIWTCLMFSNKESQIGDKIRVVGYVTQTIHANSKEKKFLKDSKFIVLAMGLVDFSNDNFLFLSGAEIQKQQWINGKIPSSN